MADVFPRANQKIRVGDMVRVISGREGQTNKTGKVLKIIAKDDRVIVEKVNMVKRHQKPTQEDRQGGIVEKEAPIHLSNIMFVSRASAADKAKAEKGAAKKKVAKKTTKKKDKES